MTIDSKVRQILDDYRRIDASAMSGAEQLRNDGGWTGKAKAHEIENAVQRLALLIMQRYGIKELNNGSCKETLDPAQVAGQRDGSLDNLDTMLDCRVSVRRTWTSVGDSTYGDPDRDHEAFLPQSSIRKALNASRNNVFFWIDSAVGPLWGKTNTLIRFENEVFSQKADS